jgi:hypothetical protein
MAFRADRVAAKRLAAEVAEKMETEQRLAEHQGAVRRKRREATPSYYVEQKGGQTIWWCLAVALFSVVLLWVFECSQREKEELRKALNVLRNNANNVDDLKNPAILQAVLEAEARANRNLLFGIIQRAVTDSFLVTGVAGYEAPFREALESALKQHWFVMVLCVTIIAGFFVSLLAMFHYTCTRRLWVSAPIATNKEE